MKDNGTADTVRPEGNFSVADVTITLNRLSTKIYKANTIMKVLKNLVSVIYGQENVNYKRKATNIINTTTS